MREGDQREPGVSGPPRLAALREAAGDDRFGPEVDVEPTKTKYLSPTHLGL